MRPCLSRYLTLPIFFVFLASCGGNATAPMPVEPDGGIGDGAGPPPAVDSVDATLEVRIDSPDRESVTYRIRCQGDRMALDGAVDLDPVGACAALADARVQDRLLGGAPADRMCTQVYGGPERATIRGSLDGRPVDTVVRRNDGCGINDWDNLLAGLLTGVERDRR